ncbi:hypothetical protein PIROE2DRAFT_65528 [Piromyces sp. E2]|nr:hypothetical protein PIROE2DRAFT_65528 [Piromyces sp. E2]|eukprot:OUM56441.1 hypothetical protein PIROE2DRAFT_65528 [Piromyces sp. E2]
MTKDEVLKIKPEDYEGKKENQCPDFANGDYWYLDRCGFEFYCKDDKTCSSVTRKNNTAYVEFPDANGNMKSLIADICDPKSPTECSIVHECKSDSECLTNKCVNNHCAPNDDLKMEKCQDTYHWHTLIFSSSVDMNCGKPDGYSCKSDSDCASDICENKICQFQGRDHGLAALDSVVVYACICIGIAILSCIACCVCCCGGSKKNKRSIDSAANTV